MKFFLAAVLIAVNTFANTATSQSKRGIIIDKQINLIRKSQKTLQQKNQGKTQKKQKQQDSRRLAKSV